MQKELERVTFTTSREMEFFTEKELTMQIGHPKYLWPVALTKELMDNALDACENAGIAPMIEVTHGDDAISVHDNGLGLPEITLRRSLNYMVRVSDKAYYVSPTRGQLGNALKCVWAAPYVASGGQAGQVDVITGGTVYTVKVLLDRIGQRPEIELLTAPDGLVKTGTLVKMYGREIACCELPYYVRLSYKDLASLVRGYGLFNPHATLSLLPEGETATPTATTWRKWRPSDPTSPHWYTTERLRSLIAAYINDERNGGKARTVRDFAAEFGGLSGTAKQKAVTELAGLSGAYLHDLIDGRDVSEPMAATLLQAMQSEARPVKPAALGCIGDTHMLHVLVSHYHVAPGKAWYKRIEGNAGGLPFVLEVALGIYSKDFLDSSREVVIGLNWSPSLNVSPLADLPGMLEEAMVESDCPVVVAVHLAYPRLDYTDRGKGQLALPEEITRSLGRAVETVTKTWRKAMKHLRRDQRVKEREVEEMQKARRQRAPNVKEAAYRVLPDAYRKASAGGTLPANARQIMYAARPLVLDLTGGKCWKDSSYFTQHLLPDFMDDYPHEAAGWNVVFDSRGRLVEPHTRRRADLGTLEVRRYIAGWSDTADEFVQDIHLDPSFPTCGPANRYNYALFIEKEGFYPLLEEARFAERFDMAIMSTKGMSVTACRSLVEHLSRTGVTILVLHDFDKAGFSILSTLQTDTRRYHFAVAPRVIDFGLRLADVQEMTLQSEPVDYDCKVNPCKNLLASGATKAECDFLVSKRSSPGRWTGQRIELNAMDSGQFVAFLERKLQAAGVGKVLPAMPVLELAYRRARRYVRVQDAVTQAMRECASAQIAIPADLVDRVSEAMADDGRAWDDALWEIARLDTVKAY